MSESHETAERHEHESGRPTGLAALPVFTRQVGAELRKVIWPTRKELVTYSSVVLVFVLVMAAVISVFDLAFAQVVLAVFGG